MRIESGWRFSCWNQAFGQIDTYPKLCEGTFDSFIVGVYIFAIGILFFVLNGIKKNHIDSK